MNKILKRIGYILGISTLLFTVSACDDDNEVLESVEYDRLFAPTGLEFRVNQVDVTATWGCLSASESVSYVIQIFKGDTGMTFEGTPLEYTSSANSCLMEGLDGASVYSFRIKAVSENKESNWAASTFETGTEQIMESVALTDIGGTYVTLRWPAGETNIQNIMLTPTTDTSTATVDYTVTTEDMANGYAYIEGLTAETDYTAVMYSTTGSIRGQRTFTTTIDTGNMTVIRGGTAEDLIAAIEADNGEGIFLFDATTYNLGSYTLTKDITIAGNPATPATIAVSFKIESSVNSLSLTNLVLNGSAGESAQGNLVELTAATGSLSTLTINGCEVTGYSNNFIYNNNGGTYGDIIINNCYVHDTCASGGDGLDFRGGLLNSITVTNTTFANGFRTFLRCQAELTGDITFQYCTFYNVCINNNSNNHGLFRITDGDNSTFSVLNCLFYGIGFEGASGNMGVWARTGSNMEVSREIYEYNYWFNSPNLWGGRYTEDTGVATEGDPGFVDAANGDLTITHEDMIFYQVGDPRWRN